MKLSSSRLLALAPTPLSEVKLHLSCPKGRRATPARSAPSRTLAASTSGEGAEGFGRFSEGSRCFVGFGVEAFLCCTAKRLRALVSAGARAVFVLQHSRDDRACCCG